MIGSGFEIYLKVYFDIVYFDINSTTLPVKSNLKTLLSLGLLKGFFKILCKLSCFVGITGTPYILLHFKLLSSKSTLSYTMYHTSVFNGNVANTEFTERVELGFVVKVEVFTVFTKASRYLRISSLPSKDS